MKRLLTRRRMSVVRPAAIAAALLSLGAFAAVPAAAQRNASHPGARGHDVGLAPSATGTATFTNGRFSCNGVVGGTPTGDFANITSNTTFVTAVVTINRVPVGTFFSGQLWQSNCSRTKNFQGTVPLNRQVTVTDLRAFGATGAFLQITFGTGAQENSTLVRF